MGTFRVTIEIGDPRGERWKTVDALVDTGASDTFAPRSLLARLGLKSEERWPFRRADDREVEYDVAQTQIRIAGRTRSTLVAFEEEGSEPMLGASTLEMFHLGVDPVGRRLIPVPGLRAREVSS